MSEPYVGEIKMFAGPYAPVNWLYCNGKQLLILDYQALYSVIGTRYGGDGITTFALPDFSERLPIGMGQGGGLSSRVIGQKAGSLNVTLTTSHLPAHSHAFNAGQGAANATTVEGNYLGDTTQENILAFQHVNSSISVVSLAEEAVGDAGGNDPHGNVMPCMSVNFIIAINGVYPKES